MNYEEIKQKENIFGGKGIKESPIFKWLEDQPFFSMINAEENQGKWMIFGGFMREWVKVADLPEDDQKDHFRKYFEAGGDIDIRVIDNFASLGVWGKHTYNSRHYYKTCKLTDREKEFAKIKATYPKLDGDKLKKKVVEYLIDDRKSEDTDDYIEGDDTDNAFEHFVYDHNLCLWLMGIESTWVDKEVDGYFHVAKKSQRGRRDYDDDDQCYNCYEDMKHCKCSPPEPKFESRRMVLEIRTDLGLVKVDMTTCEKFGSSDEYDFTPNILGLVTLGEVQVLDDKYTLWQVLEDIVCRKFRVITEVRTGLMFQRMMKLMKRGFEPSEESAVVFMKMMADNMPHVDRYYDDVVHKEVQRDYMVGLKYVEKTGKMWELVEFDKEYSLDGCWFLTGVMMTFKANGGVGMDEFVAKYCKGMKSFEFEVDLVKENEIEKLKLYYAMSNFGDTHKEVYDLHRKHGGMMSFKEIEDTHHDYSKEDRKDYGKLLGYWHGFHMLLKESRSNEMMMFLINQYKVDQDPKKA